MILLPAFTTLAIFRVFGNGPQDARLRHQVVQERCNVLAVNLAEEQAEFNAKQFQAVTGLI